MSYAPVSRWTSRGLGGLTVSSTEVDTLDAKMRNLDADIRAFPGPPMFAPGAVIPSADFLAWHTFRNGEWLVLMTQWGQWNAAHQTVISQTGDAVAGEYAGWVGKYNEALRRFQALGGKTQAEPVEPGSSAISEALAALPWGKIALTAGAVVGAYWLVALGGAAVIRKAVEAKPRRARANAVRRYDPTSSVIAAIRRRVAAGDTLVEAARHVSVRMPEQCWLTMDYIGSWPAAEPELRALQKMWP